MLLEVTHMLGSESSICLLNTTSTEGFDTEFKKQPGNFTSWCSYLFLELKTRKYFSPASSFENKGLHLLVKLPDFSSEA